MATTPTLVTLTATWFESLRHLLAAVLGRRADAAQVLDDLKTGRTPLHVIWDEQTGLLAIGRRLPDGTLDWLDSVCVDPSSPGTFGKTPAELEHASGPTH